MTSCYLQGSSVCSDFGLDVSLIIKGTTCKTLKMCISNMIKTFLTYYNYHTNKCTYIKFHIKTLKIAPTCFDPKVILRELRCSLLKSF